MSLIHSKIQNTAQRSLDFSSTQEKLRVFVCEASRASVNQCVSDLLRDTVRSHLQGCSFFFLCVSVV